MHVGEGDEDDDDDDDDDDDVAEVDDNVEDTADDGVKMMMMNHDDDCADGADECPPESQLTHLGCHTIWARDLLMIRRIGSTLCYCSDRCYCCSC